MSYLFHHFFGGCAKAPGACTKPHPNNADKRVHAYLDVLLANTALEQFVCVQVL